MPYTIKGANAENYNKLTPEEQAMIQSAGESAYNTYKASAGLAWDNPASGYQTSADQVGQEASQRAAEALFTQKSNQLMQDEEKKSKDFNTWISQNPNASSVPSQFDPNGQYVVKNGVLTNKSAISEEQANEAGVANGTLKKVKIGNGWGYVPTGSAADKLNTGIQNGTVSPTDPNQQHQASMQGNNVNAPGVVPVAPNQQPTSGQQQMQGQTQVPGQPQVTNTQTGGTPMPVSSYTGSSIVDYLKSIGQGSDFTSRRALANSMGISDYSGTASQNTDLLHKLRTQQPSVGSSPASSATAGMVNEQQQTTTGTELGKLPSTGNPTIDALLSKLQNASPQTTFTEVYKKVYEDLGLADIKTQYDNFTKEYTDLQNEKNDKAVEINNNPWLTEGVRVERLRKLDEQYKGREGVLESKIKMAETMYDNGRQDAQFTAGHVIDQMNKSSAMNEDIILKAIDIAEKQSEAQKKLTPHGTPVKPPTMAQQKQLGQDVLRTGLAPNGDKIGNGRGSDGFVDPYVYLELFNQWTGTTKDFLASFPVKENVNPLSYNLLPEAIKPTVKTTTGTGENDINPKTGLPNWMTQ